MNGAKWSLWIVTTLLASYCPGPVAAEMETPPLGQMPDAAWYESSLLHAHMSVGFHEQNFQWPGVERFQEQVRAIRPDAIQFHGGGGRAAELGRQYGYQHVEVINRAGTWRPEYDRHPELFQYRVAPDGSVLGRIRGGVMKKHLCFNSPGIEAVILPDVYRRQAAERRPAQIWIDENLITVNLCWCPHCRRGFHEETGLDAPQRAEDPGWAEFARFHRDTFVRWQQKIYQAVQQGSPGTLVTFNHCYWLTQPETPPVFIRNLSADIHHDSQGIEVYGRYGSGIGMPFDIMPGLSAKTWAGTDPKPLDKVLTEVALIAANGGRWNIGEFPTGRRHPIDDFLHLAERGAQFVRARQAWSLHTRSVPQVAVLQSKATHYARVLPENADLVGDAGGYFWSSRGELDHLSGDENPGPTRIYFHNNRQAPDAITGAAEALAENQVHFDIINDDTLLRRLAEYQLLIVPEQFQLTEDVVEAIRAFVVGGGRLLATGGAGRTGLEDVLGIAYDRRHPANDTLELGGVVVQFAATDRVTSRGADVILRLQKSGSPAVTSHRLGQGRAVHVAADLFQAYEAGSRFSRRPDASVTPPRAWLGQLFAELLPDAPLSVEAPPWVTVYLRTRGQDRLVHVVDRTVDWGKKDTERQPDVVTLDLEYPRRPDTVLVQPEATVPDWSWHSGRVHLELPIDETAIHRIVEVR